MVPSPIGKSLSASLCSAARRPNVIVLCSPRMPKLRFGRFPAQALSCRRLPLINVLPIGIQRSRYAIPSDPGSQHSCGRPDRFLFPQATARRPRGVIHHIHQTSPGSPLLKPRMETPIQLHQVADVLPPFPALPVCFPSAHAAP
jgi:hypothetical protein